MDIFKNKLKRKKRIKTWKEISIYWNEHRMHYVEEDGDCTQHFFWRCSCGYQGGWEGDPIYSTKYSYKWPSYNSKICPRSRAKQQLEELDKYNVDLRRRVNGMKDKVYVV